MPRPEQQLADSPPARAPEQRAARPRVCQLLHTLNVGGAEVLAERLGRGLSEQFEFVFVCLDEVGDLGHDLRRAGYRVECLDRRAGFDWRCARRLADLCRDARIELIHAHQYTPFSYALLSGLFRRRPPILFTEHGRWYPDIRRPKRVIFNRLMLRSRDRVVGVGESVRQALIMNEGIAPDRVGVIYNGVDLEVFAAPDVDTRQVRAELDLTATDFVLMQVARLDALKDHETALRMLEIAVRQAPNLRLVLVGEGDRRAAIEQEIDQRKLRPFVRMLGLRNDVPRLLAAADVFLLTSVSEGIPVTFIEAMARQLPIVSTAVGGVPEVVEQGVTGLLAPSGDEQGLAAAALQLVGDAALRRQMGEAGRRRAEDLFSQRKMHDAYARMFREMLHAPVA